MTKMDVSSRDIFQSRRYKINRVLLSLLGLWPFQRESERRMIFSAITFISSTQSLTKIFAMVTLRNDLNAIVECIPPLMIDLACTFKLMMLVCNMKKIRILLANMQRDWDSWATESEYEILHKFAEIGRILTVRYAVGLFATGSFFSFIAVVPLIIGTNAVSNYSTRPIGFPYHVEYYVDLEKYYYPAMIHNYLTVLIHLFTIIAVDTCVIILVQHCCGLFSVVRCRLENMQNSIKQDKQLASLEKDEKFYKNFVYCIQKHEEALQFVNCLETVYRTALTCEICVVVAAMTFSGLQAVNSVLNFHNAMRHGLYITSQILHLFIACWLGQQIIDHSSRVFTSVYTGEWYESSSKAQKLLNMIMLRSSSPSTLSIGKVMVVSLPTFGAIIRVSASYFTVLRSVQ